MQGTVAITGGGRGLGAATARRVAADGADVVVGYHRDRAAAEGVADDVRAFGREAVTVAVDIADEASVAEFFRKAEELGPMTGFVANAGAVTAIGPLESLAPDALRHDLDVLLLGPILTCRAAIAPLERGGGSMVLISSGAATLGSAGEFVHYAAAKAGIDALAHGLSVELAPRGIRVNTVAPGLVTTDFHPDPARLERLRPTVPWGRAGDPSEVAAAVAWLLSDDASYTTGALLRVAGGR